MEFHWMPFFPRVFLCSLSLPPYLVYSISATTYASFLLAMFFPPTQPKFRGIASITNKPLVLWWSRYQIKECFFSVRFPSSLWPTSLSMAVNFAEKEKLFFFLNAITIFLVNFTTIHVFPLYIRSIRCGEKAQWMRQQHRRQRQAFWRHQLEF